MSKHLAWQIKFISCEKCLETTAEYNLLLSKYILFKSSFGKYIVCIAYNIASDNNNNNKNLKTTF